MSLNQSIPTILQVAAGGALGASARYMVVVAARRVMGIEFPWGTIAVNVVGSFLIGVLIVVLAEKGGMRFAPFLVVGVLGGFTTFSAFSLDVAVLFERGELFAAALYVAGSVFLSVVAVFSAMALTRWAFV
jgi:CrcB protein